MAVLARAQVDPASRDRPARAEDAVAHRPLCRRLLAADPYRPPRTARRPPGTAAIAHRQRAALFWRHQLPQQRRGAFPHREAEGTAGPRRRCPRRAPRPAACAPACRAGSASRRFSARNFTTGSSPGPRPMCIAVCPVVLKALMSTPLRAASALRRWSARRRAVRAVRRLASPQPPCIAAFVRSFLVRVGSAPLVEQRAHHLDVHRLGRAQQRRRALAQTPRHPSRDSGPAIGRSSRAFGLAPFDRAAWQQCLGRRSCSTSLGAGRPCMLPSVFMSTSA